MAIYVIYNLYTHPINLKSGEIEVTFFPPNVTSLMQPMDQDVLKYFYKLRPIFTSFAFTGSENDSLKEALTISI